MVAASASNGTGWRQKGQSVNSMGPDSGYAVDRVITPASSGRAVTPRLSRRARSVDPPENARMTPPAIETHGLRKAYGRTVALEALDLRVEPGEVFGFLGPNGAGKTTAVKLLLGLTRPTAGTGTVLGRPLGDLERRRRVGYLPELFRYQAWLTAREVLALHAQLAGLPPTRPRGRDRPRPRPRRSGRPRRRPDRRLLEGHAAAPRARRPRCWATRRW